MAILHKLLAFLTFSFIAFHAVFAYGSLLPSNYAKVNVGEIAEFDILFWTEVSEKINFYAQNTENVTTIIIPNPLILNPYNKDGEIVIGGKVYNVSMVKVLITPKISGKFEVVVFATRDIQARNITFVDERAFKFVVESGKFQEKEQKILEVIPKTNSGKMQENQNSLELIVYLLIFILILIISFLIYKYS